MILSRLELVPFIIHEEMAVFWDITLGLVGRFVMCTLFKLLRLCILLAVCCVKALQISFSMFEQSLSCFNAPIICTSSPRSFMRLKPRHFMLHHELCLGYIIALRYHLNCDYTTVHSLATYSHQVVSANLVIV